MTYKRFISALFGLTSLLCVLVVLASPARAAPYAAMVIDARSGEVLHSRNADTRLHPASLTKMMTLYIAFEAVRLGELTMDTPITISSNAAAEPPSRLGLRAGQTIRLRYLVRAAAVRSANDAATAIGEAIAGSEAAFARRMNRTAAALGMTRTTFRNAHGLTQDGHMSTARDMTTMGRRIFYDYPQYYNIFSRRSTDAGIATVRNTNRAFLDAYRGADGIKTGYTRAAGFNLVASAERGQERIIATVFGGQSTAWRNQRMMELLDMGFARAPSRAAVRTPSLPVYTDDPNELDAQGLVGRTIRPSGAVTASLVPLPRPRAEPEPALVAAATIEDPVEMPDPEEVLENTAIALAERLIEQAAPAEQTETASVEQVADAAPSNDNSVFEDALASLEQDASDPISETPRMRPDVITEVIARNAIPLEPEIVTRASSDGSRLYGVSLGRYPSRNAAERLLLQTALAELSTFQEALRHVVNRSGGYEAQFAGMTEDQAGRACARLMTRNVVCTIISPQ